MCKGGELPAELPQGTAKQAQQDTSQAETGKQSKNGLDDVTEKVTIIEQTYDAICDAHVLEAVTKWEKLRWLFFDPIAIEVHFVHSLVVEKGTPLKLALDMNWSMSVSGTYPGDCFWRF